MKIRDVLKQNSWTDERISEYIKQRDKFAGQAMQGLLAGRYFGESNKPKRAYEMADLMMTEREK